MTRMMPNRVRRSGDDYRYRYNCYYYDYYVVVTASVIGYFTWVSRPFVSSGDEHERGKLILFFVKTTRRVLIRRIVCANGQSILHFMFIANLVENTLRRWIFCFTSVKIIVRSIKTWHLGSILKRECKYPFKNYFKICSENI